MLDIYLARHFIYPIFFKKKSKLYDIINISRYNFNNYNINSKLDINKLRKSELQHKLINIVHHECMYLHFGLFILLLLWIVQKLVPRRFGYRNGKN